MAELFDMIAGTSTGALLGATIAIPKAAGSSEPKYYAKHFMEEFINHSPEIFTRHEFDWTRFWLIVVLCAIGFFGLGYLIGERRYTDREVERLHEALTNKIRKLRYEGLKKVDNTAINEKDAQKSIFGNALAKNLGNALLAGYDDLGDYKHKLDEGSLIY